MRRITITPGIIICCCLAAATLALATGLAVSLYQQQDDEGSEFVQTQKMYVPVDNEVGIRSGPSVSVHGGTTVLVGAHYADSHGAAYIFEKNPATGNWIQTARLAAPDAAAGDRFGYSVSVHDGIVAVGAYGDDDAGADSGSAYIFEKNPATGNWIQTARLAAPDAAAGDRFGYSVSVHDGTVVVGAQDGDDAKGSVHVFEKNPATGNWIHVARLVASDVAAGDNFGSSVSVYNGTTVHVITLSNTAEVNDSTADGPVLTNSDHFGTSVANIGDLDGDGVNDIAAGAHRGDNNGPDRGALYIMLMNPDGTVKDTVEVNDSTPNGPYLSDGDRFGRSVANIGDLDGDGVNDIAAGAFYDDGDGVNDIAAGAFYDDGGSYNRGALHIMLMNPDGTVKDTVEVNDSTPNGPSLSNYDYFGASVANIGDLDGDGVNDIAVGAEQNDNSGGALHIMLMNPDGTVKDTVEVNDSTPNGPVLNNGDRFGISVANIGDLDGDGVNDIAAGAFLDDNNGPDRGALHIMLMNPDGTVKDTVEVNDSTPNGPSLSDYDRFGISVATIGDLDGDGVNDIAAGAHWDDHGGYNRGALHIMLMNPDGTVKDTVEVNDSTPNGPSLSDDDRFGASVVDIGDLDGDGVNDIAAGAFLDDNNGPDRGALHIMLMNGTYTTASQ